MRYVVDLAACLSAERSSDREMWIRVGTILKHVAGDDGDADLLLYAAFLAFSRLAGSAGGYDGDDDCERTWAGLRPSGAVGIGSLVIFARQDDPGRAEAAWRAHRARRGYSMTHAQGEVCPDLAEALRTTGGALSSLPDDVRFVSAEDGTRFRFNSGYGIVLRGSNAVRFGPSEDMMRSVGNLLPTYHMPDCTLSSLDKSLLLRATHTCTVVSEQQTDVTAPHLAGSQVSIYDAHDPKTAKAKLTLLGKTTFVDKPDKVASVCAMMQRAMVTALQGRFSPETSNMLLQNFGTINNTINVVLDPEANRHSDHDLIKAVIDANPVLLRRYKFAPDAKVGNCNGLFVCDPETNVWAQQHNLVVEEALIGMFAALTDVTQADKKHIESRRGRSDMLYSLGGKVVDRTFMASLDANLDIFACDNVLFDIRSRTFRPINPEDRVATTSGWSYDAEQSTAHRGELDAFLAQVLPVLEERRVVLAFFASLLSGRRIEKRFMVFTDTRGGNNGKTSLANLFIRFFGGRGTTVATTSFVCRGSFEKDRNAHDAGIEGFRSSRLLVADELKRNRSLDEALLKRLTGGGDVDVGGRSCGGGGSAAELFKYRWQAGIVLIFNEGDCPKFDTGDAAFMSRMIVSPMRAKFVSVDDKTEIDSGDKYTRVADKGVCERFPFWMSSLFDILVESFDAKGVAFDTVPKSMKQWRDDIVTDSNPIADWLRRRIMVTGNLSKDHVVISDLRATFMRDHADVPGVGCNDFSRLAKGYFSAMGIVVKDGHKVNGITTRGVVTGVAMRPPPVST